MDDFNYIYLLNLKILNILQHKLNHLFKIKCKKDLWIIF